MQKFYILIGLIGQIFNTQKCEKKNFYKIIKSGKREEQ